MGRFGEERIMGQLPLLWNIKTIHVIVGYKAKATWKYGLIQFLFIPYNFAPYPV